MVNEIIEDDVNKEGTASGVDSDGNGEVGDGR